MSNSPDLTPLMKARHSSCVKLKCTSLCLVLITRTSGPTTDTPTQRTSCTLGLNVLFRNFRPWTQVELLIECLLSLGWDSPDGSPRLPATVALSALCGQPSVNVPEPRRETLTRRGPGDEIQQVPEIRLGALIARARGGSLLGQTDCAAPDGRVGRVGRVARGRPSHREEEP